MKTPTVLTRIIPTLSAVKDSRVFNVVIAGAAAPMAEDLRTAANDDLIDAASLVGALQRLAVADGIDGQQAAMAEALLLADMLLGSIAEGRAVRIERVAHTAADLVRRITTDVSGIIDVFQPMRSVFVRIRRDASELAVLIDAEIRDGLRPPEHALVAERVFDAADRLLEASYGDRDAASRSLAAEIEVLAA